jgi:hypothetical protein
MMPTRPPSSEEWPREEIDGGDSIGDDVVSSRAAVSARLTDAAVVETQHGDPCRVSRSASRRKVR